MAPKKKTFTKVQAVKTTARATIGAVKATRAIPHAKEKAEQRTGKHKKPLTDLMERE